MGFAMSGPEAVPPSQPEAAVAVAACSLCQNPMAAGAGTSINRFFGAGFAVGLVLLILIHELGHGYAAKRVGLGCCSGLDTAR
jgi:hypothetical protein